MMLNIVTNEELLASQIVKSILLVIVGVGIIYNIFSRPLKTSYITDY
ncbi:MAG TPA: hypothetical protein VIN72_07450 [Lutibacter sp.]